MIGEPHVSARIDPILAALRELWLRYPEQGFGQLLDNVASEVGFDLWAAEEDKWVAAIKQFSPQPATIAPQRPLFRYGSGPELCDLVLAISEVGHDFD